MSIRAVCFSSFGIASEVAEIVELADPPPPGPTQITVDVVAAPIDPGHLLLFEGRYGAVQSAFPIYAGNQGVGVVRRLGNNVHHLREGDMVLLGDGVRGTWRDRLNVDVSEDHFALPPADPIQLSFVLSTMTTAFLMLERTVGLEAGDCFVQNAGNSAVGLQMVRLAHHRSQRSVNIVRGDEGASIVREYGGDFVILDRALRLGGATLPTWTEGRLKYGFDAVGGAATNELANLMTEGGCIMSYGLLSGHPNEIYSSHLVFRNLSLRGFWRSRWAREAPAAERREVYRQVAELLAAGVFKVPVEAVYSLDELKPALVHAARGGRGGKVVLSLRQ